MAITLKIDGTRRYAEGETTVSYGDWNTVRTNVFLDPYGDLVEPLNWLTSTATPTQIPGTDFGSTYAVRFANNTTGAWRSGPRMNTLLAPNTLYTVRFKTNYRNGAFPANSRTVNLTYRPASSTSTTGQVIVAAITVSPGDSQTWEFTFTTLSTVPTTGFLGLLATAGNTGERVDFYDFEVEVGDTTGQGFIGPIRLLAQEQVAFTGTYGNSTSVLQTRVPVFNTAWVQSGEYEAASYSASEDATPIDGGDSSGATGQISFAMPANLMADGTELLLNKPMEIEDGSNGRVAGTVAGVSIAGGFASLTAETLLTKLVVEKQVAPFVGTLEAAFTYYLGLAGITAGQFYIDPSIASRNVVFPGFFGSVWDFLKQLCVAQQVEIAEVSSLVIMRPLRTRTLTVDNDVDRTWQSNNSQLARTIEIYNYNSQYVTNGLLYPTGGWNNDTQIYQVDAGETLEVDVPVDGSVMSIVQPTIQTFVSPTHSTSSVYAVSGADGLPIPPAQWTAQGGKLTVSINEDRKSLTLTIVGATETKYAPYRIAMSSGDGNYYSSLRLVGQGVTWKKELLTLPTGVPLSKSANDVGVTIDTPFVDNIVKAYEVGMRAAQRYASPAQSISVTATVVNRRGDVGNINLPPFSLFNSDNPTRTFSQWNTLWTGVTFEGFTTLYTARVQDTFENQAFGNVGGARVRNSLAMYRVRTATITPGQITYTAEHDTTFGDFNTTNTGRTFAQYNALWAKPVTGLPYAFEDLTVQPLRGQN